MYGPVAEKSEWRRAEPASPRQGDQRVIDNYIAASPDLPIEHRDKVVIARPPTLESENRDA